jgi:hypothetical protein
VKRETYINIHFDIKLAPEFFDANLIFCITFPDKLAEVLVVRFPQLGFNVKFQLLVMTRLAPEAEVLQAWRRFDEGKVTDIYEGGWRRETEHAASD